MGWHREKWALAWPSPFDVVAADLTHWLGRGPERSRLLAVQPGVEPSAALSSITAVRALMMLIRPLSVRAAFNFQLHFTLPKTLIMKKKTLNHVLDSSFCTCRLKKDLILKTPMAIKQFWDTEWSRLCSFQFFSLLFWTLFLFHFVLFFLFLWKAVWNRGAHHHWCHAHSEIS